MAKTEKMADEELGETFHTAILFLLQMRYTHLGAEDLVGRLG